MMEKHNIDIRHGAATNTPEFHQNTFIIPTPLGYGEKPETISMFEGKCLAASALIGIAYFSAQVKCNPRKSDILHWNKLK